MSPSPKSTLIIGLVAIFLIGAVAGGLVGARLGTDAVRKQSKIENLNANIMDMLSRELSLRSEQVAEIEPMVSDACDELREVHRKGAEQVEQIIRRYHDKLAATQLDPEQLAKLKALEAERRSKFNHTDQEPKNPLH